jgi:hypothetical protein
MKQSYAADFEEFWRACPRRTGKLKAEQAYAKARKLGATQKQLLDGLVKYVQHKPSYADYCHPATWLNQGRWLDEYGPAPKAAPQPAAREHWILECQRLHSWTCQTEREHKARLATEVA